MHGEEDEEWYIENTQKKKKKQNKYMIVGPLKYDYNI